MCTLLGNLIVIVGLLMHLVALLLLEPRNENREAYEVMFLLFVFYERNFQQGRYYFWVGSRIDVAYNFVLKYLIPI